MQVGAGEEQPEPVEVDVVRDADEADVAPALVATMAWFIDSCVPIASIVESGNRASCASAPRRSREYFLRTWSCTAVSQSSRLFGTWPMSPRSSSPRESPRVRAGL